MKSFFKNVQVGLAQRKGEGVLAGKIMRLGQYSVRVENHIGEGGFASIYKVRETTTGQAFALKHMRLAGDQECIRDMTVEVQTMMTLRRACLTSCDSWLLATLVQSMPGRKPTC